MPVSERHLPWWARTWFIRVWFTALMLAVCAVWLVLKACRVGVTR
jgi:hypothetical protein